MMRINTAIPKNVAPSGFPIWRSLVAFVGCGFMPSRSDNVAFSRNSWVIAIPIEAKAREVRSQARKVRSYTRPICQRPERFRKQEMWNVPRARWSLATLPLLSSSTLPNLSTKSCHHPSGSLSLSSPLCFEDRLLARLLETRCLSFDACLASFPSPFTVVVS